MLATVYKGDRTFSVIDREIHDPGTGEVRIQVAYTGVCGTDIHIYHGMMDKRVAMPGTIGHEMSGTIDALGEGVTGFAVGDKVVVRPLDDRGAKPSDKGFNHICADLKVIGVDSAGSMQQYWNVPAFTLHKLPADIDMQLAALIEPLSVAVHDVRMAQLRSDETAVVLGGGPIGLLVALVARETGAQVIVSEVNERRMAKAKEFGLHVVDPGSVDLPAYIRKQTEGRGADVVFEVAGVQATVDIMTELAGIRGRIAMVAIHGERRPVDLFQFFWKELQLIGTRLYEREDYGKAIQLVTEHRIPFEKLITDVRPLSEIQQVFEAIDSRPDSMKVLMDCQR